MGERQTCAVNGPGLSKPKKIMHLLFSPLFANIYYIGGGSVGLLLVIVVVVLLLR